MLCIKGRSTTLNLSRWRASSAKFTLYISLLCQSELKNFNRTQVINKTYRFYINNTKMPPQE